MNCRHCHAKVDVKNNFCPACGARVASDAAAQEAKFSPSHWKWLLSIIFCFIVFSFILLALFSDDITDTVTGQLAAIREGKITESYYDYTSRLFQKATSLTQFREFLKAYPEFEKSQSIRFIDRSVDGDSGALQAKLTTSDGMEVPLQYSLVKEGEKWKIVNIKLEQKTSKPEVLPADGIEKTIERLITGQLELIRQGKLQEAYENDTSASFKKATPSKEFEEFIRSQPGFSDNSSFKLGKLSFDNNVGKISGVLMSKKGLDYPVNYDLVQEGGSWKIAHVEVEKPLDSARKDMAVSKVVLGNAADFSGVVSNPETVFKSDSGDIYLNVHIVRGIAGANIEVSLGFLDNRSFLAPVSTRLTDDGNANAIFIFSPPASGWPKGDYKIEVKTSTGFSGTYDFKVYAEASKKHSNLIAEAPSVESNEIFAVIESQLKALRANDIESAYNKFTTESFRSDTSLEAYKKIVSSHQALIANKLFKYDTFYIEDGIATFGGELVSVDGTSIRVEFDVSKEGKSWKIDGMQLFQFERTVLPNKNLESE